MSAFEAIQLDNHRIRVSVVPSIGGKIHEFVDLATGKDLLFHHPRVELRPPVFGANVDNWWTGGIDDCIPTGHPCFVDGEELPFLGEVWSLPWQVESADPLSVTLSRAGIITPFRLRKRISLRPDADSFTVDYDLMNIGYEQFRYLWGIHPAFPLGSATRIEVPASSVEYSDGRDGTNSLPDGFKSGARHLAWPVPALSEFGATPNMSWHHAYLSGLSDGRFSVVDDADGSGVEVSFPTDVFPFVHIWVVDGGWRGIRVAVVEPWTGAPARLDKAIEAGLACVLQPGETVNAQLRFRAVCPTRVSTSHY